MAFDLLAWALGWALGKAGEGAIKALTPNELSARLSTSIESWAEGLPSERSVNPNAIFARFEPEPGPARRLLFQRLTDSVAPSNDEWLAALLERWHAVRSLGDGLQPFFTLNETEATEALSALSQRLADVCLGDERMYRNATTGLGDRIRRWGNRSAVLAINEITEPERWETNYSLGFHLHNPKIETILVSRLEIVVEAVQEIQGASPLTPGAAIVEHEFEVLLPIEPGRALLTTSGPRRFQLEPGKTEFFRLYTAAREGYEYRVRIVALTRAIPSDEISEVTTEDFYLIYRRGS